MKTHYSIGCDTYDITKLHNIKISQRTVPLQQQEIIKLYCSKYLFHLLFKQITETEVVNK